MAVFISPLPPPNGDKEPSVVSYPPFPAPQNAATQAPLPNPPWPSPASPMLAWPLTDMINLATVNQPITAAAGMPLRSAVAPAATATAQVGYAGHVSPAVAAYQNELRTDILFRSTGPDQARWLFVYEQAKYTALQQPKMGAVHGNDAVINAPDFLPNAPAQHRCLDRTGLDRYRCYDKSPGPFDSTVQYIRARRGRQCILNQTRAYEDRLRLLPQTYRASIAPGVASGM